MNIKNTKFDENLRNSIAFQIELNTKQITDQNDNAQKKSIKLKVFNWKLRFQRYETYCTVESENNVTI